MIFKKENIFSKFSKIFEKWVLEESKKLATKFLVNHTIKMFELTNKDGFESIFTKVDKNFYN